MSKLQPYYDSGLKVFRKPSPERPDDCPIYVGTQSSRRQAQHVTDALNAYLSPRERAAIARDMEVFEAAVVNHDHFADIAERVQRMRKHFGAKR